MSMLDKVMAMLPENFSIEEIAEKAGMSADEAKKGGEALFAKLRDGSTDNMTAIKEAAAEAGVDPEKLKGLLPAMAEKAGLDGEGGLMDKLGGDEGLLGKVSGFLDRDGDGNPINDLTDMAKGFFRK
ncbi:hypothetical protein [Sphingorhabdus sp. 109]|jgi:hypothetical protein|uniref:hypothetical protein n=1 Tax=Sphingorhabdus sp. 109 TaxID=2653173 RepID=UPI0012F0C95C|nr:hypothetical protein [Sphingorhabdus sp. 109]VWX56581.1 conserved hypothetical protein [Sphingorhabdus sp. 109]